MDDLELCALVWKDVHIYFFFFIFISFLVEV